MSSTREVRCRYGVSRINAAPDDGTFNPGPQRLHRATTELIGNMLQRPVCLAEPVAQLADHPHRTLPAIRWLIGTTMDRWRRLAATRFKRLTRVLCGPLGPSVAKLGVVVSLAGCGASGSGVDASVAAERIVGAAGWTRIASTDKYFVVANVLPGERMFSAAEAAKEHPLEGELIIAGTGRPVGPNVRHVEAHVYDRQSGLPLNTVKPTIVLFNQTTGERLEVGSTLMQDVNIGAPDIHYGNNVTVRGNSDLHLVVTIGDEEVTLDGHLD